MELPSRAGASAQRMALRSPRPGPGVAPARPRQAAPHPPRSAVAASKLAWLHAWRWVHQGCPSPW
eukprot:11174034-Lingulodinium_polyedra.AAC.1